MKRKKLSKKASKKIFKSSGGMTNSKNQPTLSRGGIRF